MQRHEIKPAKNGQPLPSQQFFPAPGTKSPETKTPETTAPETKSPNDSLAGGDRADKQKGLSTKPGFPGDPVCADKPQESVSAQQPPEGEVEVRDAECGLQNDDGETEVKVERKKDKFFGGYEDEPFHQPPSDTGDDDIDDDDQDENANNNKAGGNSIDKSAGGRPPVFDGFAKAKVAAMIAAGVSQRTAAAYLNIHPSTISKALQRDPAFKKDVVHSQAAAEVLPLLSIKRACESNWRAAVWMLEHGQPVTDLTERAAKKQRRRQKREDQQWLQDFSQELVQRESEKELVKEDGPWPPNKDSTGE